MNRSNAELLNKSNEQQAYPHFFPYQTPPRRLTGTNLLSYERVAAINLLGLLLAVIKHHYHSCFNLPFVTLPFQFRRKNL